MNHKQILLKIHKNSFIVTDIKNISSKIRNDINLIGTKISSQKGVFTVLVTLLTHKIYAPKQDIRIHQSKLKNGFSGRTIDTKYITPTLKSLGLPSMAESGWLTRSLEQPFIYDLNYKGAISNKKVKIAFLEIIDYLQSHPSKAKNLLRLLLYEANQFKTQNIIKINPLNNPEKLTIDIIINTLNNLFKFNYKIHGGSKLPVLAFFAIYISIIKQMSKYHSCTLLPLGSHTASDRTSHSAGDIEIFKEKKHFEVVEIKLDKKIDIITVRIAIEKIKRFNPHFYYILSYKGINKNDEIEITKLCQEIKANHGCELIINGLMPTIKYYLRLISYREEFIENLSNLIETDTELKIVHKEKWNELIKSNFNI